VTVGIVAQPSYDFGYYRTYRGVDIALPILNGNPVHTKMVGEFFLEHSLGKPVALYVVSNGNCGCGNGLGAFPAMWMR